MEYIIEFSPYEEKSINNDYYSDIEKRISSGKSISKEEANAYLRTISYEVRNCINPNMNNYDYKCDLAQSIFGHYFNKIGCKYFPCATHTAIANGVDGHSFTIVALTVDGEEKYFLLDPTYIQFFHIEKCQKTAYFVSALYPNKALLTPDAGYFIKAKDKHYVEFLLKYGYIDLTPECARIYGDSFLNTKTGIDPENIEYKTIPGSIYINSFLKGKEPLSKSEEELVYNNQGFIPFQERTCGAKVKMLTNKHLTF